MRSVGGITRVFVFADRTDKTHSMFNYPSFRNLPRRVGQFIFIWKLRVHSPTSLKPVHQYNMVSPHILPGLTTLSFLCEAVGNTQVTCYSLYATGRMELT